MLTEVKTLIKLASPIFIAQLSVTSMSFVDSAMAGHYHRNDLAAIAIGTSLWLPTSLFTQATLFSVTPFVAQAHGKNDKMAAGNALRQGCWLGLFVGLIVALLLMSVLPLLNSLALDKTIIGIAQHYLLWLCLALPIAGIYQAMRGFIEGNSRTKPIMIINFMGFLLHIPINYALIYGKFGLPEMGGAGCGLSLTLVFLLMSIFAATYILLSDLKTIAMEYEWTFPNISYQLKLLKLGLPMGFSMLAEVSVFTLIALLVAPLGVDVVAGHQVALNISAQTFMLPFSLSMALTIRVGYFLGQGNTPAAKHTAITGLKMAVIGALCAATFIALASQTIATIYTDDVSVQNIAVGLLVFSAIYQFPDYIQVCSIGILRAFKITKLPMLYTIIAYWMITLPLGYSLGLTDFWGMRLGAKGLWMGLVVGLTIAAILLLTTVYFVIKQSLEKQNFEKLLRKAEEN